jgi:hypothetical protein
MLIEAYRCPHTAEAAPGLRAAIDETRHDAPAERNRAVLAFLGAMPAAFDVIEAAP